MTERQAELLATYRASVDILEGLTRVVSDDAGRVAGDGDDRWSAVEIVCHLRDAEERSLDRTRRMRDEDRPALIGYNELELAERGRYHEQSLAAEVAAFRTLREQHIRELEALDENDWARVGLHNQMGQLTIESITQHMVYHDAVHLAQIARRIR